MINFFRRPDHEVNVYDFNRMRLLTADTIKKICMRYDLIDLSPPSIIKRNHEGIHLKDIMEEVWDEKMGITEYIGTVQLIYISDALEKHDP
jgi:hypothetical protein